MNLKRFSPFMILTLLALTFYLIFVSRIDARVHNQPNYRARGYSLTGELRNVFLNNGRFSNINGGTSPIYTISPAPEGYYHGYHYLPQMSFIVGIPGRDPQGNPYPWTMRPMVDSLGNVYPDSIVYWGATVSESWFDRTFDLGLTDWEADSLSHLYLFGNATNQDIPENSGYRWISPDDPFPVLAHSNYPFTWPGGGWPGFWGWDENGVPIPGQFFSDEDIYWEMDDRTADRDVDPTQGYPTGIKVKAMASGFEEIPGGFIILRYRLINQSQWDYKDIYTGFYLDADSYHREGDGSYSGRTPDDDIMRVNIYPNWVYSYIYDLDDNSSGVTDLAYTGVGYLETPPASRDVDLDGDGQPDIMTGDPTGATGWHYFDWYFRPGARDVSPAGPFSGDGITPVANDKETIQYKLMAADTSSTDSDSSDHAYNMLHYFHPDLSGNLNPRFDSQSVLLANYPNGLDCQFILSNGPFNLDSGDSTEVVAALVSAPDSVSFVSSLWDADRIYDQGIPYKEIHLVNGNGGEVFTGSATLTWYVDPGYPNPIDWVRIYLGKGYDTEWEPLAYVPNNGTHTFNATSFEDGSFYKVGMVSQGNPEFVYGVSDTFFVINDPNVNVPPELVVFEPQHGDTLNSVVPIRWLAVDPDFDPLYFSLEVNYKGYWTNIIHDQVNTNYAELHTNQFFNGDASLKITINGQTSKIIDNLTIDNGPGVIPDTVFHHISGYGNGMTKLTVLDQQALTGHTYRLEFDSVAHLTSNSSLIAHVYDIDAGAYVAQNIDYTNKFENTQFDGLNLILMGFFPSIIDSAYWKIGNSTWEIIPYRVRNNPASYELVFDTMGVDTVFSPTGVPAFPVPFHVYNRTYDPNTPLRMLGFDTPPAGQFNSGDHIFLKDIIVGGYPVSPPQRTYRLIFNWDSTSVPYQSGDVFRFTTANYFWEQDTILFKSPTWLDIDDDGQVIHQFALYQNYPNPFNPTTTIKFRLPYLTKVKIEIFNILGQRVRTLLDGKRGVGEHKIQWDGRNDSGQSVATGMYIYRMKAEDAFVKSRKMLLIR